MDPIGRAVVLILALALAGFLVWLVARRRHSKQLRTQFGAEYGQAVAELGGRGQAEAALQARKERVEKLDIKPLSSTDSHAFAERWRIAQAAFVDDPGTALRDADVLITEVMVRRGYPMDDFEQRAADISVDHPNVVSDYRAARAIAMPRQGGRASTEELREAMVHYRALFDALLEKSIEASTGAPLGERAMSN